MAGDDRYGQRGRVTGDFDYSSHSVLHAAGARPLKDLGDDVIRFSQEPALGGPAWVAEVHRDGSKFAVGEITFFAGHPSSSWVKIGWFRYGLSAADYDVLSGKVDQQLTRTVPEFPQQLPNGSIFVGCTDGPGYLTERRKSGQSTWLSGFCGDHPNKMIADLMFAAFERGACRFGPHRSDCPSSTP